MTVEAAVHVVDDDDAVRDSLGLLLQADGWAVYLHASAAGFLGDHREAARGCIVADLRMPGMDGLELLRRLAARGDALPVVMVTGHGDVPLAVQAMKAGAFDFIEKPFDGERLLAVVRAAVARSGERRVVDEATLEARNRVQALTAREREVLELLVAGKPNKLIAYDLGISARTVEIHRARVMEKLGVRSLPEAVRLALAAGLGDTP